jgi:hypothetical protein
MMQSTLCIIAFARRESGPSDARAGLVTVYVPIHVEPRYLTPLTPLICLLAMARVSAALKTAGNAAAERRVTSGFVPSL